jgi:hypothetical protein
MSEEHKLSRIVPVTVALRGMTDSELIESTTAMTAQVSSFLPKTRKGTRPAELEGTATVTVTADRLFKNVALIATLLFDPWLDEIAEPGRTQRGFFLGARSVGSRSWKIGSIFEIVAEQAFENEVPGSMRALLETYALRDEQRLKQIAELILRPTYETPRAAC